jgi:RNA recognition motif-containing protein
VYCRNLEQSIKVPQLREALTELFSEYGEIIDIVAKTNFKAKGQAFVVFDSVDAAQKAIEDIQGFDLFGRPMQLAFARTRSDATVKRSGDEEEFESHKRRRLAEKGAYFACCEVLELTASQIRRRPLRRPSSRSFSRGPRSWVYQTRLRAPSRPHAVPDSNLRILLALPSFPTSTSRRTRSSSCRIYPMGMILTH